MASIERLRKGCWRVRWREAGRNRSSPRFATESEAAEFLTQAEARETARRVPDGLPLTGRELAERWRLHLAKRGRTARYVEQAADRVAVSIGDQQLSHLTLDALRALPLGRRRVVQAALRWAVAELGAAVPPACLKLPTGPPPRRTPTDLMPDDVFATIQAAADQVSAHLGTIVHLVGVYGHRPESLAKLRPADLDLAGARLSLTVKGGDRIRHPILPETVERLRRAPPPFLDPGTGKPFALGWDIARVYRSCLGRSRWKPEPGIYALKRRAISRMLGMNLDAATVASITGHRRPDILLRHYARTNEARQEQAVAALAQSGDTGTGRVRQIARAQTGATGHRAKRQEKQRKQT